jgi:hypothetical protein
VRRGGNAAWLLAVLGPIAVDVAACTWPAILGHDDPQTVQHVCGDGTVCPLGFDCPAPFSGGRCEWHSRIPDVGAVARRDGGQRPE